MRNVTLQKGLAILETMAAEARDFSLAEVAELTGLDKGHACRLLQTLVSMGYVMQDPGSRRYRVGLRTLELSASILSRMELYRAGITYLRDLSDRVNAATYLGVLHQGMVLTIATNYPAGVYASGVPGFGSVMELDNSAMGRVLLADMAQEERDAISSAGVATIRKPHGAIPTTIGVAAPVRNHEGRVIAALGGSTSPEARREYGKDAFDRAVREAASGLSFALGHAASRVAPSGL
jgi:DNA-binding IclR family transcriptional regulator